ncbi:MAG: PilZ domain-containing protein [Chitinophagaceae bacterium]|nr:PilZ domain-containing protein [Oligoflexus sp.]
MSQDQGASSKISNPESISRLVARMCAGNLQVLLRHRDSGKVTIRGAFHKLGKYKAEAAIQLFKLSEAGLSKLEPGMPIKVEVLGMPSQLTFQTLVIEKTAAGIICAMPRALLSTERRTNARFRVTENIMAFMSFDLWKAGQNDPASPPFFSAYGGIASWITIADISLGGVCLLARFPSFQNASETITGPVSSFLHLPMMPPIPLKGVIRWRRKIKNRVEDEINGERFQLEYRIGFEFAEVEADHQQKLRHFIRQLTIAEAI